MPEDEFERSVRALLENDITDALFEAGLQGPIPYNDEGLLILMKAVQSTSDQLGPEEMEALHLRWLRFAAANGIDPYPDLPDV